MRGRSSKQETKEGVELDKLGELQEETHLSGAYIRSLVKQLTSSGTKDPMNPKDPDCSVDGLHSQNLAKFDEGSIETHQAEQPPQPQQHKKQVRRRLHTSRPYQERLLNMAEARREIVTALKFHRAAMKQQQQQQQQQQIQEEQQQQSPPLQPQSPPHPCFDQEEGRIKSSRRNPRVYPSSTANFCHYLDNLSYSHPPFAPYPFSWPAALPPFAPPSCADTLNFTLPNQPLGLNLNFRDFCNLETNNRNIPPLHSSSSPSSSSFPNLSVATEQEVPSAPISQQEVGAPALADAMDPTVAAGGDAGGGLHAAMDDEEMAEIRSIGEQHQMEWNDTMNLATSAWWFKFLKTMELGSPDVKVEADDEYHPFHEVLEFSAGLDANESCFQQHLYDYGSEDYFQDPALPCMDIGEIEGMDEEWLA